LDWIVEVSHDERSFGSLKPPTANLAYASLKENGCVILRGAFADRIVDAMYREFSQRFGGLDAAAMAAEAKRPPPNPFLEVGDRRYEITLKMTGPLAAPEVFANPLLMRFLSPVLGSDLRLSGFTTVVSHPGANAQHTHRDHAQLFPDQGLGQDLPVHAVNVSVPLIDVELETGPTAVWLGSHRLPDGKVPVPQAATIVPFARGDAILIDYRTLHAGTPNKGTLVRPVVYMVYARTWFFDEVNHEGRASLDMPLKTLQSLPKYTHPLLSRAYRLALLSGDPEVRGTKDLP
jgi:ectoine hydroxylase-related dioxygenase (phytanoyl-CoA dioxygenase family)